MSLRTLMACLLLSLIAAPDGLAGEWETMRESYANKLTAHARRIAEIEAAITRDEAALSDATLYGRDPARFATLTRAIETARAEKDAAEERWLTLAEAVEALG